MNLSILIVDDNKYVREGIKITLNKGRWKNLTISNAKNGEEAISLAKKNKFDVVLMDISMPVMGGKEATAHILKNNPQQKIIAVSMHSNKNEIELIKKIGAKGYILKEDVSTGLINIIESVLNGNSVFDLNYY